MPSQLQAVPEYKPSTKDLDREAEMKQLLDACMYAKTEGRYRAKWDKYKQLHASRPPEWVGWDERRKGLRK